MQVHSSKEFWKTYRQNDNYSISNLGRVRRRKSKQGTCAGKILSPINVNGYRRVNLWREGKCHSVYIHRAVVAMFKETLFQEGVHYEVAHRNGNVRDNRVRNLITIPSRFNPWRKKMSRLLGYRRMQLYKMIKI